MNAYTWVEMTDYWRKVIEDERASLSSVKAIGILEFTDGAGNHRYAFTDGNVIWNRPGGGMELHFPLFGRSLDLPPQPENCKL